MSNSKIRDNHKYGEIGKFLQKNIKTDCHIDIVSAYFTVFAYHNLKTELESIKSMRFLFGEPTFIKDINPNERNVKNYKIEYDREEERLEIPLQTRLTQKKIAKDCHDWLLEKAEIKSMVKPNFLHGKMYHIKHKEGTEKAIVGSSNFTSNGLGFGGRKNIELNMIISDDNDRADLSKWFDEIWNCEEFIQDVKEEVLRYLSDVYIENSPEFIYQKTLFHIFDRKNEEEYQPSQHLFDSKIYNTLYEFQKLGVKGVLNRIRDHGGCILADSVGLGKTYTALAVIKEFEIRNKSVLVVCPKKISANWELFQASKNNTLNPLIEDRFQFHILYHTDMGRASGKSIADGHDFSRLNWGAYDLVVIDESHNFRGNPSHRTEIDGSIRLNRVAWFIEKIVKSNPNTKVLLLSATPVNTTLKDLRNQIAIITKEKMDALSDRFGITDIAELLKKTQKVFTDWAKSENNEGKGIKQLVDKIDLAFFKILDEFSIARSRKQIMKAYSEDEVGKFPHRLPPIPITPKQKGFEDYIELNNQILDYKLSVFNPSAYIIDDPDIQKKYADQAEVEVRQFTQQDREMFLIGMMKMNFLKRLESSILSFKITIERTLVKIDAMIERIDNYLLKSHCISIFEVDDDMPEEEFDDDLEEYIFSSGKKLKFDLKDLKLNEWLHDLKNDKTTLKNILISTESINPENDDKLNKLKDIIINKKTKHINPQNKKLLIFTAFADTAVYLYHNLKNFALQNDLHIAMVTGGKSETTFGKNQYEHILTNFSPISKNRNIAGFSEYQIEQIDILIGTDCISEGQNLQDCDTVINYDIHWNPIRIIQRFGRIDRLQSKNDCIQLINFWPTHDLEKYIQLKSRVESRMTLGNIVATGDEDILGTTGLNEYDLKFREKQLLRLKDEILDLEEIDRSISLTDFSFEHYRDELLYYINKNHAKITTMPLGMYAVVPANSTNGISAVEKEGDIPPGVIYCLKHRNPDKSAEKINPISPYFLVYIKKDGSVQYNFANVKQILDLYHQLCAGVDKPYNLLCDIINSETNNGENMEKYADLIHKAIQAIKNTHNKKSVHAISNQRNAMIPALQNQIHDDGSFDLITWLIIR